METSVTKSRRTFRWGKEARDLVKDHLRTREGVTVSRSSQEPKDLVAELVRITGNPRDACWRFSRQLGMSAKQAYREWTPSEEQKLLDLIALNPAAEVARLMRRSEKSVRAKLHKLGANAHMGCDWFTPSTLAKALHIRADEVHRWIERGWLTTRSVQIGRSRRNIIDADAFSEFCKLHRKEVVGRRLSLGRLDFIQNFVFPPSHAELLPVRERGYKKGNKSVDGKGGTAPVEDSQQKSDFEPDLAIDGNDDDDLNDIPVSA